MLSEHLTPTRLVDPRTRPKVTVVVPQPPSRHRPWRIVRRLARFYGGHALRRLTGRFDLDQFAVGLRELFEDFGGLWIKTGQLLSLRIDIFSPALCRELAKLQYRATGFPSEMARRVIEEDLGASIDQLFEEFHDTPFAVASMGQVHRARLRREKRWVAVKVQRPFSAETFARDLTVIQWLVRTLELLRIRPFMRWRQGLWELRQIMREELDFRFEASAMARMRKSLRDHGIYVPKVFVAYNAPRVLMTEFIVAVLMADYIKVAQTDPVALDRWRAENNVNPKKVAKRLVHSLFRQLFEDNLYHGDLHPGNIVLLRDSRVALIDFGTTAFTEREYLQKFTLFVRALATRDYAKAADLCFLLSAVLPNIDVDAVKEKLVRALRAWATRTLVPELPYHDKSIDNVTVQVTTILFDENCTMDWAFLRIRRAITTLDASLILLYPDANYTALCQQYFRKAEGRALKQTFSSDTAVRLLSGLQTGLQIAERINEYTLFQGALIRRHAQVFQGATSKISNVFAMLLSQLSLLVLAHGVLILIVLLQQSYPELVEPILGAQVADVANYFPRLDPQIWIALQALDAYVFWSLRRLRRRLLDRESRAGQRGAPV